MNSDRGVMWTLVVVLLSCVLIWGDAKKVRCIGREREALLSFKNGLIDEAGILSSWRGEECCNWYGVVCKNTTGNIISLRLYVAVADYYKGGVRGKLSSSLIELHHLTFLDLTEIYFGDLPIPEFIGSMKQLQHLYLRKCSFSGIVPPQLGNLTNLRSLDLSGNFLSATNLDWLSGLSLLSYLDFSHFFDSDHLPQQILNLDFRGPPIPEFIGSMKLLQHLNLAQSGFSGIVPPQLGNLTNLRTLDLSNNFLSATNLNWLSSLSLLSYLDLSHFFLSNHTSSLQQILNLPSLKELHLQSCNITDLNLSAGHIVNSSSSSTSLSVLDLSGNYLTSPQFNWLSNISSSLVQIHLAGNRLSGQIPDVFERFVHLEFLDVSYNMLEGEIPKSLGNLTHLRALVLFYNGFSGQLHDFVGNISSKAILGSLEILDLANNQLTGSVPDLVQFSALTELYLGMNELTGSVPPTVGQLAKLRIFEVSYNNLSQGSVSESHFIKLHNLKILDLSFTSLKLNIGPNWRPPFQLEYLYLAGCKVGPTFPKWIQTQINLTNLDLSSTGIEDEGPLWLWSFSPSLQNLFLSHNQITGTIPDLSSNPLMGIDLSDNKFSGHIPLFHPITATILLSGNMLLGSISSICETRHDRLEILGLSNNQLSGELPNCWEKMPNLFSIKLDSNSFSHKIPHSLGYLRYLIELQLRDNNLSGELPPTLRFCRELEFVDVEGNELTGEIPPWIGEISQLRILNLGNNILNGSIPCGICNLTHIKILDVHMNNLSEGIPDCFNNFTMLASIQYIDPNYSYGSGMTLPYNPRLPNIFNKEYDDYSLLGWKGQESKYTRSLVFLGLIDLSSNRLTGNIPLSFSSLRGIRSLNLSRNSLTGNIISDIGQMEELEVLDLSKNQLSGEIPPSLAKLHFLAFLDLSNNNLSGEIPSSTQLQSFNASSYAGNNGLCGKPLTLCPEDIPRPPTTTIARGEKGDVFSRLSFMQGLGISMAFGFIFGFWGLIGSFILKKSWRYAFFNSMDAAGEWLCLRYEINIKRWRSDTEKKLECGRVHRGVRQS